jgi:threonine dehydrogenase-like Zn-dependent dehydrogenase
MSLSLQITHLVAYDIGDAPQLDAIAIETPGSADATVSGRCFVPGFLPCGECGRCRRALVGACTSPQRPLLSVATEGARALEVPARFVVPIDEPVDAPVLAPTAVALAGPLAFASFALASANVVPGDLAIWVGDGVLPGLGVAASRNAGAHGFAFPTATSSNDARIEDSAGSESHGTRKRVIFVVGGDQATWGLAQRLSEPGATLVQLGVRPAARPLPLAYLPPEARLICLSAYHPDFLPEAFASLRREPALGDAVIAKPVRSGDDHSGLVHFTLEPTAKPADLRSPSP